MNEPITVGQKLYRDNKDIQECTVEKVGRKYFYIKEGRQKHPINKETLKYEDKEYSQHNLQLYRTKKEIEDKNEQQSLFEKLRKHFDWSGNGKHEPLDKLLEVVKILDLK